jgi:putative PIN family toxin of toxin-antitoxin system
MTVVIDTNVVLSAILFGGKPRQVLEKAVSGSIELAVSEPLVTELQGVLQRPKFGLSAQLIRTILSEYGSIAIWKEPSEHFDVIPDDPSDNHFIDCAVAAKADYLITGDKHLLNLGVFRMTKIVGVDDFLDILSVEGEPQP